MLPLSWTETDENATNLKLEALWILINLGYAESDDLEKLFMKNQNYENLDLKSRYRCQIILNLLFLFSTNKNDMLPRMYII